MEFPDYAREREAQAAVRKGQAGAAGEAERAWRPSSVSAPGARGNVLPGSGEVGHDGIRGGVGGRVGDRSSGGGGGGCELGHCGSGLNARVGAVGRATPRGI
jgi:hypothetical protein